MPNNVICKHFQFNIFYKFQTLPKYKSLQTTILNFIKMAISSRYNFSFSHGVFKRLALQTHKNQGLFGKGLNKLRISVKSQTPLLDEYNFLCMKNTQTGLKMK